jgi:hypothetical protein
MRKVHTIPDLCLSLFALGTLIHKGCCGSYKTTGAQASGRMYVLFALDQLIFAERHTLIPYSYFGKCAVNGHDHGASGQRNRYYDGRYGENM